MSASIYWRQVPKNQKTLNSVWAPSSFIQAMESTFGQMPITLGQEDTHILRGMAAAYSDKEHNPYAQLVDLIARHDCIEIWATY